MDRWRGTVAVVTGASSGIGASICKRFVEEGLQVVGLARRVEKVEELSKTIEPKRGIKIGKLYGVKCDVTKQEEIERAFKWTKDKLGPVQIVINNAGLFKIGTVIEGDPVDVKTVFDTNVLGVCWCSREGFRQMREAALEGHVIHINSIAGHQVLTGNPPVMNAYSPSKHAVTALTEVMRLEVNSTNAKVRISSISPGYVDTEIMKTAGLDIEGMVAAALVSEDIADSVVYVLSAPLRVHIQELTIRPFGENLTRFQ